MAIVQPGHGRQTTPAGWIAAVLNDEPHNDAVVERTMGEARPRKAPVLLVDRREDSWLRRAHPARHRSAGGSAQD